MIIPLPPHRDIVGLDVYWYPCPVRCAACRRVSALTKGKAYNVIRFGGPYPGAHTWGNKFGWIMIRNDRNVATRYCASHFEEEVSGS